MAKQAQGYRALATRPLPDGIVNKIKEYGTNPLKASRLVTWVKLTSGAGLTIVSNPNIPTFGMKSIHGDFNTAGSIGQSGYSGDSGAFDGIKGVGYRPRPIIESVEVKNGKRGLSRKATIKVKCFTLDQLQQIAKYFNEPGFTLAVEWGWNTNESLGQIKKDVGGLASLNNLDTRESDSARSKYDYDNFLGNITGGGMSVGDGTFDLTIEATGLGDLALNLQENQQTVCAEGEKDEETPDILTRIKNALAPAKQMFINTLTSLNNMWDKAVTTNYKKMPFLEMYSDLPSEYQIERVKKLGDGDVGKYYNYVGFNSDAKEKTYSFGFLGIKKLARLVGIDAGSPTIGKADLDGEKLFDEERFIRFGTLMRIIEAANVIELDEGISLTGGGKIKLDVNTRNVPITAHKRIFSTNKSKLLILNKNTPDFGIVDNFTKPERNDPSIYVHFKDGKVEAVTTASPNPVVNTLYPEQDNTNLDNGNFVRTTPLNVDSVSAASYTWGYLEDLYINFDFAFGIIKKEGILKKDAILEMLNGMSSACNNLWDFEITEDTDENGNQILTVSDMNFVGFNTNIQWPSFVSWGVNSPFKSYGLDIDIPSAMKNQIIAKRLSGGTTKVNQSMPEPHPALWSEGEVKDLLMLAMNTRVNPCESEESTTEENKQPDLNKNAQEFAKKAGIYIKAVDPKDIKDNLMEMATENTLYVGTFNDSGILNYIRTFDFRILSGADLSKNPGVLLPITFNFTVIGTGGFEFGHAFKVSDIFEKFAKTGIFQIREVTHSISDMTWETSVEAQFRPLGTV